MSPHGSNSTYTNWSCRCGACTEAHRVYVARARQRRAARPFSDVPHGTDGGYSNWCCRCPRCRRAHTEAKRAWRAGA